MPVRDVLRREYRLPPETEPRTMTRIPARGLILLRAVQVEPHLPGGRIHLLDTTVENMVMGQAEIVAVGPPPIPDDPDDCEEPLDADGQVILDDRLTPGAWVLVNPRAKLATDVDGEWLVLWSDVVGVFSTNGKPAA